jgi:hypothetical protein
MKKVKYTRYIIDSDNNQLVVAEVRTNLTPVTAVYSRKV